MRNLLLIKFLFLLSYTIYAQNEVFKNVNDISQFVEIDNSVNVILLGENHKGEYRQNILCEYVKILNESKIDTVFIEQRYSTYVMSLIHNNIRYMNCDCLINANKVIVPVDIELNLAEALEVVGDILSENNLVGTNFYDENINVYSQYRKSGTFNQKFVLYYIKELQKNVEPFIKKYNAEFNKLLNSIYETYSIIEPHEFDDIDASIKRDSLMSVTIGNYINDHKLKRWGGVFGSYHISLKEDHMFDKSVELDSNLIQFLIQKEFVINDPKYTTRIIYDAYKRMISSKRLTNDEFIVSFYPNLKKIPKNKILIKLLNNTWWLFSKR